MNNGQWPTFPGENIPGEGPQNMDLRIGLMDDGKVALDFGSPVSWIAFESSRALELARLLVEEAGKADRTTYRIEITREDGR